jgi:hypothetical protein
MHVIDVPGISPLSIIWSTKITSFPYNLSTKAIKRGNWKEEKTNGRKTHRTGLGIKNQIRGQKKNVPPNSTKHKKKDPSSIHIRLMPTPNTQNTA